MTVFAGGRRLRLRRGHPLVLRTALPGRASGGNLALCRAAAASSSVAGNPPVAALDGSIATSWQAAGPAATLTVWIGRRRISSVEVQRAGTKGFAYVVETSSDGRSWTRVGRGTAASGQETIRFAARRAAFVRLSFPGGQNAATPAVAELSVRR
jgi:hypothetical protein